MPDLWVADLGTLPYREGLAAQERVRAARQAGDVPDTLLLVEHPPVFTCGRRTAPDELPGRAAGGIEVVDVDRGGRVTYHGPGQVVGYPIMRTGDVLAFVRTMERALVAALADEGVAARTRAHEGPDLTGVWVGTRKIGSIGIHVQRGVTTHGFAVNVDNDLAPFGLVVPCGLPGVEMTSLARETGRPGPLARCFRRRVAFRFAEAHGRRQRLVSAARAGALPVPVAA